MPITAGGDVRSPPAKDDISIALGGVTGGAARASGASERSEFTLAVFFPPRFHNFGLARKNAKRFFGPAQPARL